MLKSSGRVNPSRTLGYDTFRLGESTGGPLAIDGSIWPPLIEGRAPDLAQRIDQVALKMKRGIKAASSLAISSIAPTTVGGDDQSRWALIYGRTHASMCADLPWEDQSNADRLNLLELGIAVGSYDSLAALSASDTLAKSENPIYTHVMTCKHTGKCQEFRDWVGSALFTQEAVDKNQGTLNPWYGVPGHPQGYEACTNRFHGTDHKSVGDLLTALNKARNDSTHFTENDYDTLRKAWTDLTDNWKADSNRPREQHKVIDPLPQSSYRDSVGTVSRGPEVNLIDLEARAVAPHDVLTDVSQTKAGGSEWSDWQGDEQSRTAFKDEFGPYRGRLE